MSNDLRDDNPTQPGWYATLVCWEVEEGMFPGAHYWNGNAWEPSWRSAGIQYWPIVFDTKEAAETYAYEHDPEL
jgi:hypothetical protein